MVSYLKEYHNTAMYAYTILVTYPSGVPVLVTYPSGAPVHLSFFVVLKVSFFCIVFSELLFVLFLLVIVLSAIFDLRFLIIAHVSSNFP